MWWRWTRRIHWLNPGSSQFIALYYLYRGAVAEYETHVAEMDRTNPLIEPMILLVYSIVLPVQGSCGRVRDPCGRGGQDESSDPQNTQRSDQEKWPNWVNNPQENMKTKVNIKKKITFKQPFTEYWTFRTLQNNIMSEVGEFFLLKPTKC